MNGPSHYIKKFDGDKIVTTDQLNGRSTSKERRIKKLGYEIVTINYCHIN